MTAFALHLLLDKYTVIFPDQVRESSFDWMKLLPKSDDFFNAPIFFQRKVLQCIGRLVRTCSVSLLFLGMDIVDYGSPHSRPLAILFGASELCEQSCQLHPVCSRHHASNE